MVGTATASNWRCTKNKPPKYQVDVDLLQLPRFRVNFVYCAHRARQLLLVARNETWRSLFVIKNEELKHCAVFPQQAKRIIIAELDGREQRVGFMDIKGVTDWKQRFDLLRSGSHTGLQHAHQDNGGGWLRLFFSEVFMHATAETRLTWQVGSRWFERNQRKTTAKSNQHHEFNENHLALIVATKYRNQCDF